jgi:hypothetical protein
MTTTIKRSDLESIQIGDVLSWAEVSIVHKVRNGIYHRGGRVISLLTDFGRINPCYPDFHGDTQDVIHYTGYGRRGDQNLDPANRALHNAIASKHAVPLFNKLVVGRWEYMGTWRVEDAAYLYDESAGRMVWKFTLRRQIKLVMAII